MGNPIWKNSRAQEDNNRTLSMSHKGLAFGAINEDSRLNSGTGGPQDQRSLGQERIWGTKDEESEPIYIQEKLGKISQELGEQMRWVEETQMCSLRKAS